jgi:hypothetical protein
MSLRNWTLGEIRFVLHENDDPCWSHEHLQGEFGFARALKDNAISLRSLIQDSCWKMAEEAFKKAEEPE